MNSLEKYLDRLDNFKQFFIKDYSNLNSNKQSADVLLSELIKKSIRQSLKSQLTKKPEVKSHIIRL